MTTDAEREAQIRDQDYCLPSHGYHVARRLWAEHVVWHNPPELGHAFIGIRKQLTEDRIIERLDRMAAERTVLAAILGGSRNER